MWLERFRRFWSQHLDALATELARGKRERRARGTAPNPTGGKATPSSQHTGTKPRKEQHTMSIPAPQKITTFLTFEGRAEEALTLYTSLFAGGKVLDLTRYGAGEAGAEGTVKHATFTLAGQWFMCIDSSQQHAFSFTAAMSLFVQCDTEDEIDRLYAALSEQGETPMPLGSYGFSTKFGWVNDRFGVSWQLNLP